MPYKLEYLTNLNDIISLVQQKRLTEASADFKNYVDRLEIGAYEPTVWNKNWRVKVYNFGVLFKSNDAGEFIKIINEAKNDIRKKDFVESLEFIYSEIMWNFFSPKEMENSCTADILKSLVKKYQFNPEFHNSYSKFLSIKGNHNLAADESLVAFKLETDNNYFYSASFNMYKKYFDYSLKKNRTDEAEKALDKMRAIVKIRKSITYKNTIVFLRDRLNDHKIIDNKIGDIKEIANNEVNKAINKERAKLIEMMGFFVAILGFVFIFINLSVSQLRFDEILLIMLGMALILSFFATLISILFKPMRNLREEPRIWLLFVFIVLFVAFVLKYK